MKNGFVIRKPDDFHVHLRDGDMLKQVAPMTASHFQRALVMPNLVEPVTTIQQVLDYRHRIEQAAPGFEPLMSLYLTKDLTIDTIVMAKKVGGIVAVKYYPRAATTNSGHGLSLEELFQRWDIFAAMQTAEMVLCVHGEDPKMPMLMREHAFIDVVKLIAKDFPQLRIVFEHVTTEAACEAVRQHKNVAATITLHHLVLTTDAVIGDHDCLCMPVAKSERDRRKLVMAATSGHPRFFFGSDSAPHPRFKKNQAQGAYGVYMPYGTEVVTQVFEEAGKLKRLNDFMSGFGADWYELPRNTKRVELYKEDWIVPDSETVRPFMAGKTLAWRARTD